MHRLSSKLAALTNVIPAARFFTFHTARLGNAPSSRLSPVPPEIRQELHWWASLLDEPDAFFIRSYAPSTRPTLHWVASPSGWFYCLYLADNQTTGHPTCVGHEQGLWPSDSVPTTRSLSTFTLLLTSSHTLRRIFQRGDTVHIYVLGDASLRACLTGTIPKSYSGKPNSAARQRYLASRSAFAASAAALWASASRLCLHPLLRPNTEHLPDAFRARLTSQHHGPQAGCAHL
jgi:hypothetical protein